MSIKDELLALKQASDDGLLHADLVVDWAEANPASSLHAQFQWDDVIAAREFRIYQARRLIQLHVVAEDGSPQMVSLSFDRTKGGGYRSLSDVLQSRDLSDIMLADALAELERVQKRYERVKELTSVWAEVNQVRVRRSRRKATVEKRTTA